MLHVNVNTFEYSIGALLECVGSMAFVVTRYREAHFFTFYHVFACSKFPPKFVKKNNPTKKDIKKNKYIMPSARPQSSNKKGREPTYFFNVAYPYKKFTTVYHGRTTVYGGNTMVLLQFYSRVTMV